MGVGDGQGGRACCGSWGHKELDMTEQLNWTDAVKNGQRSWVDISPDTYMANKHKWKMLNIISHHKEMQIRTTTR